MPIIKKDSIIPLSGPIAQLNKNFVVELGKYLPHRSANFFSRSCYTIHQFFLDDMRRRKAKKLLEYCFNAEPLAVKKLLGDGIDSESLITYRVPGTEECGRVWQAVSPLEFALWIGDAELIEILMKHLAPTDKQEANRQFERVKQEGLEHGPYMAPVRELMRALYAYQSGAFLNYTQTINKHGAGLPTILIMLQYQLSPFGLQWLCNKYFHRALAAGEYFIPDRQITYNNKPLLPLSGSGLGKKFAILNDFFLGQGILIQVTEGSYLPLDDAIKYTLASLEKLYAQSEKYFLMQWLELAKEMMPPMNANSLTPTVRY